MNVSLKFISPKKLVVNGIRICWKSEGLSDSVGDVLGVKDSELIRRIIKFGHVSTFEHSLITFDIDEISRAVLQELSRHRIGVSPSVQSSRYTLSKIINGECEVSDLLVKTGNELIDNLNIEHMEKLKKILQENSIPNDIAKYGIVESYKVKEQISFNFRSFREFLKLRISHKALWEIRDLANAMYEQIPKSYHIFFEDIVEVRND